MRNRLSQFLIVCIGLLISSSLYAQDFPAKPNPPKLVNDFAGMLHSHSRNMLEQKLVAYNDSTSTQIAVVTISSLKGHDIAMYSTELAHNWGIGQKGKEETKNLARKVMKLREIGEGKHKKYGKSR